MVDSRRLPLGFFTGAEVRADPNRVAADMAANLDEANLDEADEADEADLDEADLDEADEAATD